MRYMLVLWLSLCLGYGFVYAQEPRPVTEDEVYQVASEMFCPVCENEPLDQCYNPTCLQWKREIRERLAAGQSTDEIVNSFVARYGQHVVDVPHDPLLRILSFITPIVGTVIALVVGLITFRHWQQRPKPTNAVAPPIASGEDHYRSQIERDLE